tara:strand:+ start:2582 stop:3190 length:609 start_codon:yes stop_codon:yes gene_type:complete
MPKATKKTKSTSKTTKSAKSTKKSSPSTPAPVVQETAAAPAAAPVSPETTAVQQLYDQFSELLSQLQALRSQLTSITGNVRTLQKRADRELKTAHKNAKKSKRKNTNRQPSGFVKPTKISNELATFLGKPQGTEMARTEVTREINSYIRAQKLQDPANGRRILADAKLRKLLRLGKNDELTYFNLQKYMSPHFAKKGKTLSA